MKEGGDAPGPSESDPAAEAEQRRIRAWSQEASSRLEGVRRRSDLPPPPAPDPDDWPLATRLGCVLPVVLSGVGLVGWGVSHWGLALAGQATIYLGLAGLFLSFAWMCGSVGIYAVTVAPFLDLRRSVKPLEALGGFLVMLATSLGVAGRIFLVGLALVLVGGVLRVVGE
ncbi:hypothetical protein IIA16_04055 [bacterium]|nr:hypothetical protein [bacterium]